MQIVRVEHEDGYGMFRSSTKPICLSNSGDPVLNRLWNRHSTCGDPGMPLPCHDGIDLDMGGKNWYCGFGSMDDFNKWVMPDEAKALISYGFKVLLISANEFQIGGHQVVYTKSSITSVEDISSLFK